MSDTNQPHGDPVDRIYHTTDATAWKPESGKPYAPDSMTGEGFIHACTWSQLPGVAARFFAARYGIVVLEIDAKLLPSEPIWEDLSGSGKAYPHIYSAIPTDAVIGLLDIAWDEKGAPLFHRRDAT